jgi:hypothetical protein
VEKIVAFALGSLTYLSKLNPVSNLQHAFVLALREALSPSKEGLKCYTQDPLYTGPDKEALALADICVLNDPDAFLEADNNSILLSISPDIAVRQVIADICRPAMIIWDRDSLPFPTSVFLLDYRYHCFSTDKLQCQSGVTEGGKNASGGV